MAYLFASYDLQVNYGMIPAHAPGSNIALTGIYDLPPRIGKTFHDWGHLHGIQPWVEESEIFHGGRDVRYYCTIVGTEATINTKIKAFNDMIQGRSIDTMSFVTPYGSIAMYVKDTEVSKFTGGAKVIILFRAINIDTTVGTLPATGNSTFQIDGIPFTSFGLYPKAKGLMDNLPGIKEQFYSYYPYEFLQTTAKRQAGMFNIEATLIASSISDFQTKYESLIKVFVQSGLRQIRYDGTYVTCFADSGFTIRDVIMNTNKVVGRFSISLRVTSISYTGF